jgi:curved DNA-binding protein CbpA
MLLRAAFRSLIQPRITSLFQSRVRFIITGGSEDKDYYEILGVDQSATEVEIKAAYRRLAKQYHPDINATGDQHEPNAEKFREVAEAYSVLSHHESRLKYNNSRKKMAALPPSDQAAGQPHEVQELLFSFVFYLQSASKRNQPIDQNRLDKRMEEQRKRRGAPQEKPSRDSYAEYRAEQMAKERKKYNVDPRGFYQGGCIFPRFFLPVLDEEKTTWKSAGEG